jgi:pilus assembly protein CpaE
MENKDQAKTILGFLEDSHTAQLLSSYLESKSHPITIIKSNLIKAKKHLEKERSPNILVLDISGVDLPLTSLANIAEVTEPNTKVIVLGDKNDVGLYRSLLDLGITDYLLKPLSNELIDRIFAKHLGFESSYCPKLGRIIPFVGIKGGLGASLFARSIAHRLSSKHHKRVALIDLDFHFGHHLAIFQKEGHPGFLEALEQGQRIDEGFLERTQISINEKLVLFSSHRSFNHPTQLNSDALMNFLEIARQYFHYLLIDVPRYMVTQVSPVFEEAQRSVFLTDYSIEAMRDSMEFTRIMDKPYIMTANKITKSSLTRKDFEKHTRLNIHHEFGFKKELVGTENAAIPKAVFDLDPLLYDIAGWGKHEKPKGLKALFKRKAA